MFKLSIALAIAAWMVPLSLADVPSACTNMCAESTWQTTLCYPDSSNSSLCYYHKLQYCSRAPQTTAEANCTTQANLVPCVTSSTQSCSTRATFYPSCGNYQCEVGEPWTCPGDCAFYSDAIVENATNVYNTCPGLDPLQRSYVLTFDDGPTKYTSTALSNLKSLSEVAAFFVVGSQVSSSPDVLATLISDGHIAASHSFSHFNFSQQSSENIVDDVALFDEVFEGGMYMDQFLNSTERVDIVAKFKPKYWRPPYGSFTGSVANILGTYSLNVIGWNVDAFDYETPDSISTILKNVQDRLDSNPGYSHIIYLGHDIYQGTVDAIPSIVDLLKTRGFRTTRLDQCISNATGVAVYSAIRNVQPRQVQKLVLSLGGGSLGSDAVTTTWSISLIVLVGCLHMLL